MKRVKLKLVERLQTGYHRPGYKFSSNRALAQRYGICYQTANRLIDELTREGYLHRIPSSGTYVAGLEQPPQGVILSFNSHIREDNFGGLLLHCLQERLAKEGIPYRHVRGSAFKSYYKGQYSIIWGQRYDLRDLSSHLQYSLIVDEELESGVNSVFTDRVAIDHYSMGQKCGHLLMKKGAKHVAMLAGRKSTFATTRALKGFQEVFPDAEILYQKDWGYNEAKESARSLHNKKLDGCFAIGDEGAKALQEEFGSKFPITSTGDERSLSALNVEGVCIPWSKVVDEIIRLYRIRSNADATPGYRSKVKPSRVLKVS
ncbi:GntR family transcriptional regulator [Rubellicoccus peritrichatus]|uniref:GntR family transcriptional regulator n=1 Tax=Rubellicoccus peritrichatus TaxID=3080537 RepID=A0AAQ3QV16_9BACT|nr:GntR family transcriptional regulator [Puniceicoccus sp. CR14]WOO41043.1 GntR family transcriptional regulator [Puniceicoccus sp. CR14]